MASDQCFAMAYVPTRRVRFWRKLGFRFHLGEDPENCDAFQGWMQTCTTFRFCWSDRLRLLLTGRLQVTISNHLDTPSPHEFHTRMDWQIYAPGELR